MIYGKSSHLDAFPRRRLTVYSYSYSMQFPTATTEKLSIETSNFRTL